MSDEMMNRSRTTFDEMVRVLKESEMDDSNKLVTISLFVNQMCPILGVSVENFAKMIVFNKDMATERTRRN